MLELNFSPFPILLTKRLMLRAITHADAAAFFQLRSDKSVMQYLDRPLAQSIDDVLALIKKIADGQLANENITWAITLIDSPTLIGTIGFWKIDTANYRAEVGYLLHPDQQGKGLMTEAIRCILQYSFEKMKLHSVEANVNPANKASIQLLEKNGFVQEAYFKENYYYNGQFLDSVIYSLIGETMP